MTSSAQSLPVYARAITAAALALTLSGCGSVSPRSASLASEAAVKQVVEQFRLALLNKDKAAYLSLFFASRAEQIGWQAVVDDARLESIQRDRPQAIKARRIPSNNFIALIDSVVASPAPEEERISGVSVDTDGEIASASFDYVYLSNGQPTNQGREQWQLVRTEKGWKIFSVVYTIRDPLP